MTSNPLRLFIVVILAVFATAGCANEDHERVWEIASLRLIQAYAYAARAALRDCGSDRMTHAKYPEVFFVDPGCTDWQGPYLKGRPRDVDYFGTPIRFDTTDSTLKIISAGRDRRFGTKDDLIEAVPLR
jgi:hypothetical protein